MDEKFSLELKRTFFTNDERHAIIREYLSSNCTKESIWRKYSGKADHGALVRWIRELGYKDRGLVSVKKTTFAPMSKHKQSRSEDDFEILQLKKRIAELEKQLKDAEMKAIAFSTMVDIAEEEFKIPIRKKFNTKP